MVKIEVDRTVTARNIEMAQMYRRDSGRCYERDDYNVVDGTSKTKAFDDIAYPA